MAVSSSSYEGIQHGNRVDNFSTSRKAAVVTDQVLTVPTLSNLLMRKGKPFSQPTLLETVKISRTSQTQAYIGLETLNSQATDTTIQLEFAHNAVQHAAVKVMLEHFANEGRGEDINLSKFIDQEAVAELAQELGTYFYGTGTGNKFLGLEALVDDGTNTSTYGGQTRTTYTALNSTVTASGGANTLAKMGVLHDTVSDASLNQATDLLVSNFTLWSLFEQLLQPTARNTYTYTMEGGNIKNNTSMGDGLAGRAGFTALTYRGIPYIRDKSATSGVLYFLNTNYLAWYGRTVVPSDFKEDITRVNMGKRSALDATSTPPNTHGWFYQKEEMMPTQAGRLGRFHIIGQFAGFQPRRQGKLTGITTVA